MIAAQEKFALDIKLDEWPDVVASLGMKPYTADQIISWIYDKGVTDPNKMLNLSKEGRQELIEKFNWKLPDIKSSLKSSDGTTKIALALEDDSIIECVLIPGDSKRITACLSSQVGCALGCAICRTGGMGFKRDLSTGEITAQLLRLKKISEKPITNVVFMGMGEPLLNVDNVKSAIGYLTNERCLNISKKRITVSTAGVVPEMLDFYTSTGVKMAVSLNAATHETRKKIMQIENKYPLNDLMDACRKYSKRSRFRITFEYVMLSSINDSDDELRELVRLLSNINAKVNLIPFNTFPECPFKPSPPATIERWDKYIHDKGIQVNIRRSCGQDILAACGQLAR